MNRLAIQCGAVGSTLGVLAGLIELSVGAQIRPWIGNKENPVLLGFVTLLLSGMALWAVVSTRNLESPDLLIQLRFPGRLLALSASRVTAEDRRSFLQELFLPAAHEVRVQIVLAGDLVDRLESFGRFQGHFELELVAMLSSFSSHFVSSTSW